MATFITDKLLHINNDLVQLFHLDTQALLEDQHTHADNNTTTTTPKSTQRPSSSSKRNTPTSPAEQADHALLTGLRDAVGLLDLRSGAVPPMERALLAIQKVETLTSSKSGSQKRGGDEAAKLEHLFLAKAAATVYLNLLDIILNATLPLANEMEYWQSLLDSSSWRLLYILQTSPYRIFSLTRSVALTTKEHIDSLIATSEESERANHILQLIKYFPTFLKNHLISQPVSFPLAIHYEISHHRKQLQRIREYQAECLGLLSEQGLNLDPEHLEDSIAPSKSSSSIVSTRGRSDIAQAQAFVQEQISKTLCLMERVLDKASKDTRHLTDPQQQKVSSKKATRSLTMLGNLQGISNLNNDEMLSHLKNLITVQIPRYVDETENQARQFHRPSWLTRIWIPALIGYFGLKYGIQYISEHRADLDEMLEEAWETARRFVTDWVWEPSVRIMNIIRHSDDQGSLQMLGNESLKSDIASLERMVLAFGKDNYNLGAEELEALSKSVHNGDISVIMRAYESELKTPLKGAVMGHLVQTLLIQIQKTKVDVEVAMAALDKLLKANELNFAFLAVGPSLLLLWAVSSQAKKSWQRIAGKNLGIVSIQMRNSLRQVERLLNLASTDGDSHAKAPERPKAVKVSQDSEYDDLVSNTSSPALTPSSDLTTEPLTNSLGLPSTMTSEKLDRIRAKKGKVPYKTQGLILCEVHLLRTFAARLTRNEGLRDKVLEDLREIEESSLTVHQRLRTTKRMYRTYGFLGLHN
ncbi:Nuclear control of ATPase protein 2 [Linnemannia schmuckeri]|uniref:Nuclear control of ATPase protein 2 n=1 Tax=Linnemannia schmuckeri TaxID=64567 RepID=A0A9P5SA50_9FUNG|nr:Nuclear control of ATPase protein 2 [Linnemannia schmuckeri]